MLRQLIAVECIFICITFILSKSTKTNKHMIKQQQHENSTKETDFLDMYLSSTELPTFRNSTSLKMFEEITTKVWRSLPVISIPQSWVLTYCMKYTEISEDVEKAATQCQYDGTNWDCTFIEMGGGQDDFNIGKIVSLFHNLSNRELRLKLLRGAEICGKLWQKYKLLQDKRLIRMQLHVHEKEAKCDEEIKNARRATKEIKVIRRKLTNKIAELETKKFLNPKEEAELDKLHLTVTTKPLANLKKYSLAMDRVELSHLQEIGLCLSQQAAKACESIVLKAIQKLT
ncbi:hypothetical protein ANTPLA_LOCUS5201 [Anthophora plagiata]